MFYWGGTAGGAVLLRGDHCMQIHYDRLQLQNKNREGGGASREGAGQTAPLGGAPHFHTGLFHPALLTRSRHLDLYQSSTRMLKGGWDETYRAKLTGANGG